MAVSILRQSGVAFAVVAAAACGARTALDLPGADAGSDPALQLVDASRGDKDDAKSDASQSICVVPATGPSEAGTCQKQLVVRAPINKSKPSCFVDLLVTAWESGVLIFDCYGGRARAEFANGTFFGSFDGAQVDVCVGTTFPWNDGCQWNSAQRIHGTLSEGLRIDYTEAPAPGQSGCLDPCSAYALIAIE